MGSTTGMNSVDSYGSMHEGCDARGRSRPRSWPPQLSLVRWTCATLAFRLWPYKQVHRSLGVSNTTRRCCSSAGRHDLPVCAQRELLAVASIFNTDLYKQKYSNEWTGNADRKQAELSTKHTEDSAESMWRPQPDQVGLLQEEHVV